VEEPFEHLRPAHPKRILKILIQPGAKSVDGD
jgi:hypothetical protein